MIGVAGFAAGLRKPDLSRFWKTVLYVLDVIALLASAILLGPLGVVLLVVAVTVSVLIHSVRLAMQLESVLTSAAIEGGREASEMKDLHSSMHRSHKAFRWLGSLGTANLIRLLAQRSRKPDEIREIALPIAMLMATFRPGSIESLVERFDRLLRLAGKDATEAMSVADTLTAGTQHGAATFNEMLDGLIKFYE